MKIGVMSLVLSGWVKFQFFPEVEADVAVAKLTMPKGVPFEATREAIGKIEAAALKLNDLHQDKDGNRDAEACPDRTDLDQVVGSRRNRCGEEDAPDRLLPRIKHGHAKKDEEGQEKAIKPDEIVAEAERGIRCRAIEPMVDPCVQNVQGEQT